MKKNLFRCLMLGVICSALFLTGCYREEIASLHNQIDDFSKMHINPLEKQVDLMKVSVDSLEKARVQIESDIKTLKSAKDDFTQRISTINGQINDIIKTADNNTKLIGELQNVRENLESRVSLAEQAITGLEENSKALGDRIDSLKKYIDDQITDTRDWATRTFANLEEYKETAALAGKIQADIKTLNASFTDMKTTITAKIESDIAAAVRKLTVDMDEAIRKAKDEIGKTVTYKMDSVGNAVRNWVVEQLNDYYTIAETDELLSNLKAALEKTIHDEDAILLQKIEDVQKDLDQMKVDIKDAYEKAISEAIAGLEPKFETIEGKIDKVKLDMGTEFQSVRQTITELDAYAKGLQSTVTDITGRVTTLEEQVALIEGDIESLQAMDKILNGRIDSLGKVSDDAIKELKKADMNLASVDEELKKADTIIRGQIADLRKYVDGDLRTAITQEISTSEQGVRTWAEQTFVTLEKQTKLAEDLAKVTGIVDGLVSDLSDLQTVVSGQETALTNLEVNVGTLTENLETLSRNLTTLESTMNTKFSEMETWVLEQFTLKLADYYTITEIDEKLDGYYVKTDIDDMLDQEHSDILDAIAAAKSEVTEAYKAAIEEAVTEEGGRLSQKITDDLATLEGKFAEAMDALETRVAALECSIQSVVFIPDYADGKASVFYRYNAQNQKNERTGDKITLRFKVNTYNGEFDVNKFDITGDLVSLATRAYAGKKISVDATYNSGVLTCQFANSCFDDDMYTGAKGYAVSILITPKSEAATATNYSTGFVNFALRAAAGSDPSSFRLDRSIVTFPSVGGQDEVNLTAIGTWRYSIENNPSWVNVNVLGASLIDVLTGYTGSGKLMITAEPNNTAVSRTAIVTIRSNNGYGTLTLTINQEGRNSQGLTFDPDVYTDGMTFSWNDESEKSFTVTPSDGAHDWTYVPNNTEWLTVTESAFGTNGERTYTVKVKKMEKGAYGERETALVFSTITGAEYHVSLKQTARPAQSLTTTPENPDFTFAWNATEGVDMTVASNDNLDDWDAAITEGRNDFSVERSGNALTVKVKNEIVKPAKSGKLTLTSATGEEKEFTLTQTARPAQTFTFDPETPVFEYAWNSTAGISMVVTPSDGLDDWEAAVTTGGDHFGVSCTEPDASGKATVTVTPNAVAGKNGNTGKLTIKSKTGDDVVFDLIQAARPAQTLTLDPASKTTFTFAWNDTKTENISVTPSDGLGDWTATLTSGSGFSVTKSDTDGSGKGTVTVKASGKGKHEGTLTIESATGEKYTYTLKQDPLSWSIAPASGTFTRNNSNQRQEITLTIPENDGYKIKVSRSSRAVIQVQYRSGGTDRNPTYSNVPSNGRSFSGTTMQLVFNLPDYEDFTNNIITFDVCDSSDNVLGTIKYSLSGTTSGMSRWKSTTVTYTQVTE